MSIRNPFAGAKVSRPIIPGMNKNENSVLSGLTARGPGRSHPFHHLPQPLHVRWLLPQDPRSPEITAGMLEGIPLITVLHHSRMDSMDFRALPLDSLFATAEPADEAAKLSSTGPSYDEDTTFFIKGSDPLIERMHHTLDIQAQPGQSEAAARCKIEGCTRWKRPSASMV